MRFLNPLMTYDPTVQKWKQVNNSDNYNHEEGEVWMTHWCTKDLMFVSYIYLNGLATVLL